MSSTYIVEPQESTSKKDDTLIIVVNDDGTISVDQETLQNLIMNQSNANVSVVRVGQTEDDATNGDLTFTVDPPTFVPTDSIRTITQSNSTDSGLVDPFMEMDPEQLEKLETALQSEQAKQILGENVTAMLDMLTVEEQQSSIRFNIELDHCYTSRTCPSDPEPLDPLPIANSPDIDKMEYVDSLSSQPSTQVVQPRPENSRIVQTPNSLQKKPMGRTRKMAMPVVLPSSTSKNPPSSSRPGVVHHETKASPRLTEEEDNLEQSSSTESSDSEPSDDDFDFGPRGPRRGGVRARGGRKGLTTRGGSMAARRGRPNKHMDVDQVRRLNIEMAAAVDAMKTSGRNDNSPDVVTRTKKGIRTMGGKKKEEISSSDSVTTPVTTPNPIPVEKPLQTTNQVKANLINANMIRGDMILTKPGQSRNNQKVYFVQKKVVVKPNEMKTVAPKKSPLAVTKGPVKLPPFQIQTKLSLSEDGKLVAVGPKPAVVVQASQPSQTGEPQQSFTPENQQSPVKQSPMPVSTSPVKIKPIIEVKKDRKKSESELSTKIIPEEQAKPIIDQKTPENAKKHVKKDLRKSPGISVDTLGPALFSTPDIIRRVGSLSESKAPEIPDTPVAMETGETNIPEDRSDTSNFDTSMLPVKTPFKSIPCSDMESHPARLFPDTPSNIVEPIQDDPGSLMETDDHDETLEPIENTENDLRSVLDAESNTSTHEQGSLPHEDSLDRNVIRNRRGIEGEEHLLATLEMEATKPDEDLLAEALLLHDQLGVDLTDPSVLDEPSSSISGALLSPSVFDAEMLPLPETAQTPDKVPESSSDFSTTFHSTSFEQNKKKEVKDSREPIQIVRGGRVITLPPIEAPATRSKRLQFKPESPKAAKTPEIHEKEEKSPKQISPQVQMKQMDEIDSEMEDDDGEGYSDSEDDPNRLWCICKRPHNNRFMICCDVCEDWFHGKCVNVTKAKAHQYEQQGKDWVCPNCRAKKKAEDPGTPKSSKTPPKKLNKPQENVLASSKTPETTQGTEKANQSIPEFTNNVQLGPAVTQCVVCKKEARNSGIYCSDACILMHAQETSGKDKPAPSIQQKVQTKTPSDSPKPTPEARVIVFERRTGKVLTGSEAPTTSNLKTWLKEHPTFEIVRPNNFNTVQIGGKTLTTIPTQPGKTGKLQQGNAGQAKMIFAKVTGSKQTVLAPSHKKVTIVPGMNANKVQVHHVVVTPKKSPAVLKQTTIKTVPIAAKAPATPKQTPTKKLEQKASSSALKSKPLSAKKGEPEPIRVNVRKTLAELLSSRIKETDDLKLSEEEIENELALKIELEMYKFFKDTGAKYKAKYRSLVFNIKDTKNLTLFRKIADKSLAPDAIVRLSADEMASQELAEWREKETKHQLEMIKKNELDLMAQAKSIVVKTHKGELIIENDGGLSDVDPKTPVQDIVTVLNSGDNTCSDIMEEKDETTSSSLEDLKKSAMKNDKKKKERDREKDGHRSREKEHKDSKRDRSSSRSQKHRSHDRSRDRRRSKDGKRDKEKVRDRNKDKSKEKSKDKDRSGRSSKSRSKSSRSSHKEKDVKKRSESEDEKNKKEGEKRKESSPSQVEKPIEDRLWRHIEEETTTNIIDGNDSDISDREPSSTVNIKTPDINEEPEKEREMALEVEPAQNRTNNKELPSKEPSQTVWRGFVSMPEVAKFFITAQELSGRAKDLMADLPDTVDVVGRISHEIVWDYISKMMRTGSKEILVIRMTAANDEEKLPYITLYSYLNSRSRLGVVGSVSKNIKDFYIMPFPNHNQIPPVLASLIGPGFEENRPHLLLGIITRNKRKRASLVPGLPPITSKISKKDVESRNITPPPKEKHLASEKILHVDEPLPVTQMTLNSLNKAHVGMSKASIETAKISKIVPELSSKLDLTASPEKPVDDDDEPYSPGGIDGDESNDTLMKISATPTYKATVKNSTELQRKMDELNRQIEEQKMQIQNMSSSFLENPEPTLPGLGLDPVENDSDEAYSPSDTRSFTPPPQGIPKFAQPLLDKVSDITIPPNLQEILANVKKQEISKVDPYLPTKPGASFLTGLSTSLPRSPEKTYTPTIVSATKESTSTLRSLSDLDLIKKAEEELAAVAAAEAIPQAPDQIELPPDTFGTDEEYSSLLDQPKPRGLDDEDDDSSATTSVNNDSRRTSNKFVPKSGVVLSVKRKVNDDGSPVTPTKTPRTKSRWGQGPTD